MTRKVVLMCLSLLLLLPQTAEAGAVSATQAKHATAMQEAEKLGAGGDSGADLKALAASRTKKPMTATGLPAGMFNGKPYSDTGGGRRESAPQERDMAHRASAALINANSGAEERAELPLPAKVALSGNPLIPLIGEEQLGATLDAIYTVADHAGYHLVLNRRYRPSPLDPPYAYVLLKGRRRLKHLYFDNSLKLAAIR